MDILEDPALPEGAALQPQSLTDVEFFVLRHPGPLSRDAAARVRLHFEGETERIYGCKVPVVVLEAGSSLEPVRPGGWIYTYERPHSARPGSYELAFAFTNHQDVAIFSWDGQQRILPVEAEGLEPYAWRPAPVPPPVRLATPIPAEVGR